MTWKFNATAAFLIVSSALVAFPPSSSADVVTITGSQFPDRPWNPLTAADGALAGAGRAADPASSWSVNPATMARDSVWRVRATALAVDPQRNDLRASTLDYSDTSPFVNVGECAIRLRRQEMAFALFYVQDAYQQSKEQYIATEPGFGPLSFETQTETHRARFGLSAGAARGAWSGGLAIEGNQVKERFEYQPSQDAQNLGAIPASSNLKGTSVGGAAGVAYQVSPLVLVAADGRVAGKPKLEDEGGNKVGLDEIPATIDFGVTVGKEKGGHLLTGFSYQGARNVALGDSTSPGVSHDPARWNVAAGYYYKPHEQPWDFRIGFGWSPYPGEGAPRFSRMGAGVGYDLQGILVRLAYSHDARTSSDDVHTSRNWFTLGFDLKL
ncbi:MAG TPA: hypothetical protein VGR66_00890 [Candidatus Eisenbacteria bacterium]|nr:hypothetical protein [Candidatus Eisenbacteria bacterium]